MAVFLDLAPGDTLVVGKTTRIRLDRKTGSRARLAIDSNEDVERVKAGDPLPANSAPMRRHVPAPAPAAPQPGAPYLQRKPLPA
jgi:hypothetical protein